MSSNKPFHSLMAGIVRPMGFCREHRTVNSVTFLIKTVHQISDMRFNILGQWSCVYYTVGGPKRIMKNICFV